MEVELSAERIRGIIWPKVEAMNNENNNCMQNATESSQTNSKFELLFAIKFAKTSLKLE